MNTLDNAILDIKHLLGIQGKCLTDNYMIGMYNGLEVALASLEDREGIFKETIK